MQWNEMTVGRRVWPTFLCVASHTGGGFGADPGGATFLQFMFVVSEL